MSGKRREFSKFYFDFEKSVTIFFAKNGLIRSFFYADFPSVPNLSGIAFAFGENDDVSPELAYPPPDGVPPLKLDTEFTPYVSPKARDVCALLLR